MTGWNSPDLISGGSAEKSLMCQTSFDVPNQLYSRGCLEVGNSNIWKMPLIIQVNRSLKVLRYLRTGLDLLAL